MPGEHSLYRKMQIVLEHCRRGRRRSREELVGEVLKRRPLNFTYMRFDEEHDTRVPVCSRGSVSATVDLAVQLGLIDGATGNLTEVGARAADPARFDRVFNRQRSRYLDKHGLPMPRISEVILKNLLGRTPPVLPTADNIWEASGRPLANTDPRRCLNLLGQCGGLVASQRRIYLPK